jgi:hypothetical protein
LKDFFKIASIWRDRAVVHPLNRQLLIRAQVREMSGFPDHGRGGDHWWRLGGILEVTFGKKA